jgi:palmitoyltransferase
MEHNERNLIQNNNNEREILKLPPPIKSFAYIIFFYFFISLNLFITTLYYFLNKNKNEILKIIIGIIYIITLILIITSQYKSIITENTINYINPINSILNNYCNYCNFERPQRAHHCKICGVCNLKMDHHCNIILNCVGENNEKFFYLFLIYSIIFSLICFFCCYDKFSFYLHNYHLINNNQLLFYAQGSFCLNLIFGLFLIYLFYGYMRIIKIGLTSIEMIVYKNNLKACPYYNDNWKENFIKLFGNDYFKMFLPFENCENQSVDNNYVHIQ